MGGDTNKDTDRQVSRGSWRLWHGRNLCRDLGSSWRPCIIFGVFTSNLFATLGVVTGLKTRKTTNQQVEIKDTGWVKRLTETEKFRVEIANGRDTEFRSMKRLGVKECTLYPWYFLRWSPNDSPNLFRCIHLMSDSLDAVHAYLHSIVIVNDK